MSKGSPLLIEIGQGLSLMVGLPTIGSWKTAERPEEAKRGTLGFNSETASLEYWDGTQWYAARLS